MNKQDIERQQQNNYMEAIKGIVRNNTNNLVDSDISSLIDVPPLDSMDNIKNKFIEVAKKYQVTVNTNILNKQIAMYRKDVLKEFKEIKNIREKAIFKSLENTLGEEIKISKKVLNDVNKDINRLIKRVIKENIDKYLLNDINSFYKEEISNNIKISKDIEKYFNKIYQKQLIENINFKIIVKDTILINGSNEQTERYYFILNNSRLSEL